MPSVSTGLILLKIFSRRSPLGQWLYERGIEIVFNWKCVLISMSVMSFPLLVRSVQTSFAAANPRLERIAGRCKEPAYSNRCSLSTPGLSGRGLTRSLLDSLPPLWQETFRQNAVWMMTRYLLLLAIVCLIPLGCGRNERMDNLYAQRCFSCHGPSGQGDGPIAASLPVPPTDFRETVQRKSNAQIRRIIAEGRGTMPAFHPALDPSEITDMAQMVRLLSREGRDISWWERFDALVIAHCSIPWEVVLGYDNSAENGAGSEDGAKP